MNVRACDFIRQAPMGGTHPDHHRTNKQSTDFKTRTDDQKIHAEDKQRLHEERGKLAQKDEMPRDPEADATGED